MITNWIWRFNLVKFFTGRTDFWLNGVFVCVCVLEEELLAWSICDWSCVSVCSCTVCSSIDFVYVFSFFETTHVLMWSLNVHFICKCWMRLCCDSLRGMICVSVRESSSTALSSRFYLDSVAWSQGLHAADNSGYDTELNTAWNCLFLGQKCSCRNCLYPERSPITSAAQLKSIVINLRIDLETHWYFRHLAILEWLKVSFFLL